jgi:aminoglycoside phosphotransferase (APT) family kinase protein
MSTPERAADERRMLDWIERRTGGKVLRCERQARWRPAYFLDVERAGEIVPLYFRGDRGATDHGVYPLEHELKILQLLERHEIPVPHVHGFCDEPRGILMQRCPGRHNLATAESEAERVAVLDHFIDILARMHKIDLAELEAIGLERPRSAEQLGLADLAHWERAYRRLKRRPEPMIEFTLRWLRRNVPAQRTRAALLQADCGQFLFERGRVTALLDFELAYVGDPMADFAGLRNRTLSEPLGDLRRALRRYEQQSGEPVDLRAIDYHTVRFGLATPMSVAHVVADPPPGTALVQYQAWYAVYGRLCLEVMAHMQALELEPLELPEPAATRSTPAHTALLGLIAAGKDEDPFRAFQIANARRLAIWTARADLYGPALEQQDLDEVGAILGRRPASWCEADAELEKFVASAGPDADAALIRCFQRRCLRQEALLAGALEELEGARMVMLDRDPTRMLAC